jgi:hypothetical protein
MNLPLILSPGTIVADDPQSLRLFSDHVARHIFIGGGSGHGKSKLIELICRQLITHECGFTYIDPHGDGVNAILRFLAATNVDPSRIFHLKPSLDYCFSFDPYVDAPSRGNALEYEAWLTSTVDRMVRAFLRNVALADMEVMKRLRNWLSIILYAAGVDIDGRHLGLADALILTNPAREEFGPIFDRVIGHLPEDYAAELTKLRDEKSSQTRDKWMESTINMLREVLKGPLVRLVFAQEAQSFSVRRAILEKKIVLVDLCESDNLSRDQGNVIGGMLINFLLSAARRIPEHERVPHYLIIDEAENYVGEDLRMAFAELRKYLLSVCLAVQDLSSLRKGDLDLVNKVISQCGLQMTFQQGHPDDIEFLAKSFGYGSLDLTPLMTEQVLPDGYKWVPTMSVNYGESQGTTNSHSDSKTRSRTKSRQRHTARSIQESVSLALSESHSEGRSATHSEGKSTTRTESRGHGASGGTSLSRGKSTAKGESHAQTSGETRTETKGESESESESEARSKRKGGKPGDEQTTKGKSKAGGTSSSKAAGTSSSASVGRSKTETESETESEQRGWSESLSSADGVGRSSSDAVGVNSSDSRGITRTKGIARGSSEGEAEGESDGTSEGQIDGTAESQGKSAGVTYSQTPLAKYKILMRKTGHLVTSVQDQLAQLMKTLASLPDRFVLVKCKGLVSAPFTFPLEVHEVLDPYKQLKKIRTAAWKASDLQRLMERIRAAHSCYFKPTRDDQAARVARFLNGREGDGESSGDDAGKKIVAESPTRPEKMKLKEPSDKPGPFGK